MIGVRKFVEIKFLPWKRLRLHSFFRLLIFPLILLLLLLFLTAKTAWKRLEKKNCISCNDKFEAIILIIFVSLIILYSCLMLFFHITFFHTRRHIFLILFMIMCIIIIGKYILYRGLYNNCVCMYKTSIIKLLSLSLSLSLNMYVNNFILYLYKYIYIYIIYLSQLRRDEVSR